MGKGYAFWRGNKGEPTNSAPTELLAHLGQSMTLNEDGKPTWPGLGFPEIETALKLAFVVVSPTREELNQNDAWSIAWEAIKGECRRNVGSKPISPERVIKRANELAAEFFRRPSSRYKLLCSISVGSFPAQRLNIGGCSVRCIQSRRGFGLPAVLESLSPQSLVRRHWSNTRYQLVAIEAEGRSGNEAAERAFYAFNLLRGIWSFMATYRRWSIHIGPSNPSPLSVVHAGPIYSLHDSKGAAVDGGLWLERLPSEDRDLFTPSGGWMDLEKRRAKIMRHLSKLPYRTDVEELIIRYVTALDQTDHDLAFLQMWAILEKITGTIGAKYEDTIKRAIWPQMKRSLAKQMLECVRIQRNRYVHSAQSAVEADQAAYLIKSFLEPHLVLLIFNNYKIRTLSEYVEILSLPTDVETISKQMRQISTALSVHAQKSKSSSLKVAPKKE